MHFVALVVAFVAFSGLVASGVTFGADDAASRYFKSTHGNVALDVARVLTADPDDLARTDVSDHALEALRASLEKKAPKPARAKEPQVETRAQTQDEPQAARKPPKRAQQAEPAARKSAKR